MTRTACAWVATVGAVCAAFVSARAQAPEQDAQAAALLAAHRAYVGWQFGDGTLTSMRVAGNVTGQNGETIERVVTRSKGLVYRTTSTMLARGNITEDSGFTGNLFWRSDINGFTTPIYGDYAKYLASLTILAQEGTTELPATFLNNTTIGQKAVGVVRVTLKNGDPIDCYVDRQTGAYVQAIVDPGGSYETTMHVVSYREVLPGKRMIASYRLGNDRSLHAYDSFEPNAALTSDDLHPPVPRASWSFDDANPFPIALTRTRILVNAGVNGVQGRFILDTGSNGIVLDDRFADRVKAPTLPGSGEAETMRGAVTTRVRSVDRMTFGGATLRRALVYSQDFRTHDFRGLDQEGYDGLIGYDLFAGAVVRLDIYRSTMTVLAPSTDLSGIGGVALLVDLSEGIPAVPMVINGSVAVNGLLDTGNPGVAFLSYNLARAHNLKIGSPVCGNLETLTIGPITYAGQSVCLWSFASNYILLGYDFLKHFDYVFDYPHGRMFMMPNKN